MKTAASRPAARTAPRVTTKGSAIARAASAREAPGAALRGSFAVLFRIHVPSRDMQSVVRKAARPAAPIVAGAVLGTRVPVLLLGAIAVSIVGTVPPPAAEAIWRVSS